MALKLRIRYICFSIVLFCLTLTINLVRKTHNDQVSLAPDWEEYLFQKVDSLIQNDPKPISPSKATQEFTEESYRNNDEDIYSAQEVQREVPSLFIQESVDNAIRQRNAEEFLYLISDETISGIIEDSTSSKLEPTGDLSRSIYNGETMALKLGNERNIEKQVFNAIVAESERYWEEEEESRIETPVGGFNTKDALSPLKQDSPREEFFEKNDKGLREELMNENLNDKSTLKEELIQSRDIHDDLLPGGQDSLPLTANKEENKNEWSESEQDNSLKLPVTPLESPALRNDDTILHPQDDFPNRFDENSILSSDTFIDPGVDDTGIYLKASSVETDIDDEDTWVMESEEDEENDEVVTDIKNEDRSLYLGNREKEEESDEIEYDFLHSISSVNRKEEEGNINLDEDKEFPLSLSSQEEAAAPFSENIEVQTSHYNIEGTDGLPNRLFSQGNAGAPPSEDIEVASFEVEPPNIDKDFRLNMEESGGFAFEDGSSTSDSEFFYREEVENLNIQAPEPITEMADFVGS